MGATVMSRRSTRVGANAFAGPGLRLGVGVLDILLGVTSGIALGFLLGGFLVGIFVTGIVAGAEGANAVDVGAAGAVGGILGGIFGGFLGIFLGPLFMGIVFMLVESFTGSSPAGMMLGVKVVNADGSDPETGMLFGRAFVKYSPVWIMVAFIFVGAPLIFFLALLVALILIFGLASAFGPTRQTLHDKISGTAIATTK